ncbi:hypothetical protein BH11ACT2_BH11ACT2_24230 [soil metagenome]
MTGRLLAIDAGQSSSTARLVGSDRVGSDSVVVDLPAMRTDVPLLPQLAQTVVAASARLGAVSGVAIGTTGLTPEDGSTAALLEFLGYLESAGVRSVVLAHDSITSYLGAVGETRGAVVAVGTGVVTLGVGAHSIARVDGWGNLVGDAGSAYWIGRAALDAVMRDFDGRGSATALTERVRGEFPDLTAAYIELQGDPDRVRRIASYARVVDEVHESDLVARGILEAAAAELVLSVRAALDRVGEADTDAPRVCAIGGVMRSRGISLAFERRIRAVWPDADLGPSRGTGLDGAAALFDLRPGGSLHGAVARASLDARESEQVAAGG